MNQYVKIFVYPDGEIDDKLTDKKAKIGEYSTNTIIQFLSPIDPADSVVYLDLTLPNGFKLEPKLMAFTTKTEEIDDVIWNIWEWRMTSASTSLDLKDPSKPLVLGFTIHNYIDDIQYTVITSQETSINIQKHGRKDIVLLDDNTVSQIQEQINNSQLEQIEQNKRLSKSEEDIEGINAELYEQEVRVEKLEEKTEETARVWEGYIQDGDTDLEIVQARGNFTKLGDRLGKVDSQLNGKATKQEVEIERQRINNLVVIPSGTDNAETADIRIGADGKTYPSAGESVRSQIGSLNDDLGDLENTFDTEYDITSQAIKGGYIVNDKPLGEVVPLDIVPNNDWCHFIISVKKGDKLSILGTGGYPARQWCFVDTAYKSVSVSNGGVSSKSIVVAPVDGYLICDMLSTSTYKVAYIGCSGYVRNISKRIVENENRNVDLKSNIDNLITPALFEKVVINIDKLDLNILNNVYLFQNGEERTFNGATSTGYIAIPEDRKIYVSASYGSAVFGTLYYGETKQLLSFESGLSGGSSAITIKDYELVEIPSNAVYYRVSSWYDDIVIKQLQNVSLKNSTENIRNNVENLKDRIHGKTWLCVGDSLTKGPSTTKFYHDYISEKYNMDIVNLGLGGTGYRNDYGNNNAFYQRILKQTSQVDFTTVFGSGNDMAHFSVLGNYTDTTIDTICGCVNKFLDNYFTNYPTTPIGMITPSPWKDYNTRIPNNQMKQYVEKLRQIAEYRGIPFLDLYHSSNLRPEDATNREELFYHTTLDGNGDGVHPNEKGHKIIASKIEQFIKTLVPFD